MGQRRDTKQKELSRPVVHVCDESVIRVMTCVCGGVEFFESLQVIIKRQV